MVATGMADEATIGGGNVEVADESVPTSAVHRSDEVLKLPKIIRSSPLYRGAHP